MAAIQIRSYRPADAQAFIDLNLAWIEAYFVVEEEDRNQLFQHRQNILDVGGHIIIAEQDDNIVGTGALMPVQHPEQTQRRWMEVIKMATQADLRGHGIGRAVMEALIEKARNLRVDALWLETNADLAPALRLYETSGFRHLAKAQFWPTPYDRANVQMTLEL